MVETYNTLEGDLTVRGATTLSRAGETNAIAIVGGYDSANADSTVTEGEATLLSNPTSGDEIFGASELARAASAATANGVGTIYGVPVSETQTTESFTASSSISLSNSPIFNPNLHPEHSITVTDTTAGVDLTVNIVHDSPPATPSDTDTANVNPNTGEVETDTSSDYDVTYTYGTYDTAIQNAVDLPVRYVIVLTENDSVKTTLQTELSNVANDFDFKRGVVGAKAEIDSSSIANYTPTTTDWRMVEVAPALATGADGPVRTAAAVGGFLSAQPIGPDGSALYDTISGLVSLNTEYRSSEAKFFDGVFSLTRNARTATAETTSDVEQFRLVYACEVIDDVALDLFNVARDYAGGPQDIGELQTLLSTVLQRKSRGNPPKLGFGDGRQTNPYDVNVTLGSTNGVANAEVSIVPYPIAEEINLGLTVTDGYVSFDGASA